MPISAAEFEYVRALIRERAGIALEPGKEYLVESRLDPLARQEGFPTLTHFLASLKSSPLASGLHHKVVQAMTTNETSFFRDVRPFEVLKTLVLPELIAQRTAQRALNFWSAACSTGQEPYSVALVMREALPTLLPTWNFRFIASDISTEVLARAIQGRYSQLEVNRGLPASLLVKYFQKEGNEWQIKADVRRMVEFREINLTEPWSILPTMDIVFMRNVLIYFSVETKKAILVKVRRLLKPAGFLFLGSSETTLNLDDGFEPVPADRTACYRLRAG
jgi:chemotaxis protein methyltransferase CheR